MSAVAPAPATLDVSGTPTVPFLRLVSVELRKMADTRAGRWLLIAIAALTLLVLIIQMWVVLAQDLNVTFLDFLQGMNTPMGVLLPVLGVMSVTSEWSQRTAMVTFTLEPSRVRVVAAKLVSILVISVLALAIGLVLGAFANLLYGALSGNTVVWGSVGKYAAYYLLLYVFGLATGFAFGAMLLNTAAGIVVYFVYSFVFPGLFALGAALMDWFATLQPWIDFNTDQNDLIDATIHGKGWAHLVVSGLIWLALPLAIGIWRIRRAEVK
jgi:ABC-type transport system involved in multi-copper enzyme maturation permease subunit